MTDSVKLTPDNPHPLFIPNLQMYATSGSNPAIVRALAYDRLNAQDGYMRVGDWIRKVNSADLHLLLQLADIAFNEGHEAAVQTYVGLAVLLSSGEGVPLETEEQVNEACRILMLLVNMELLARKGLVEITYDNVSLDVCGDEEWVRVIDQEGLKKLHDQHKSND